MLPDEIISFLSDLNVYYLDDDIRCAYKYMKQLKEGDVAVDLGTGWGKASLALALSNPSIPLHTYDHGEYPTERGFGTLDDYEETIKNRFETYRADNIIFHNEDAGLCEVFSTALLHVDIDDIPYQEKYAMFKRWFAETTKFILVRNYENNDRAEKKIVDELLKDWKKLTPMGIIQPYESPN